MTNKAAMTEIETFVALSKKVHELVQDRNRYAKLSGYSEDWPENLQHAVEAIRDEKQAELEDALARIDTIVKSVIKQPWIMGL